MVWKDAPKERTGQPAGWAADLAVRSARENTGHHWERVMDTHLIPPASVSDGCTINEQTHLPRPKMQFLVCKGRGVAILQVFEFLNFKSNTFQFFCYKRLRPCIRLFAARMKVRYISAARPISGIHGRVT